MAYTDLTSLLKAIANSIRSKTSTTAAINAQDFPSKIDSIKVGITPSGTKSITSNGTVDVTNYASASVNVPISSLLSQIVTQLYRGNQGDYGSQNIKYTLTSDYPIIIASAYTGNGSLKATGTYSKRVDISGSNWYTLGAFAVFFNVKSGTVFEQVAPSSSSTNCGLTVVAIK